MKMAWKIGVKIHAIVLSGSVPGTAGQRLCGSGLNAGPGVSPGGGVGVGVATTLGHGAVPTGVGDASVDPAGAAVGSADTGAVAGWADPAVAAAALVAADGTAGADAPGLWADVVDEKNANAR